MQKFEEHATNQYEGWYKSWQENGYIRPPKGSEELIFAGKGYKPTEWSKFLQNGRAQKARISTWIDRHAYQEPQTVKPEVYKQQRERYANEFTTKLLHVHKKATLEWWAAYLLWNLPKSQHAKEPKAFHAYTTDEEGYTYSKEDDAFRGKVQRAMAADVSVLATYFSEQTEFKEQKDYWKAGNYTFNPEFRFKQVFWGGEKKNEALIAVQLSKDDWCDDVKCPFQWFEWERKLYPVGGKKHFELFSQDKVGELKVVDHNSLLPDFEEGFQLPYLKQANNTRTNAFYKALNECFIFLLRDDAHLLDLELMHIAHGLLIGASTQALMRTGIPVSFYLYGGMSRVFLTPWGKAAEKAIGALRLEGLYNFPGLTTVSNKKADLKTLQRLEETIPVPADNLHNLLSAGRAYFVGEVARFYQTQGNAQQPVSDKTLLLPIKELAFKFRNQSDFKIESDLQKTLKKEEVAVATDTKALAKRLFQSETDGLVYRELQEKQDVFLRFWENDEPPFYVKLAYFLTAVIGCRYTEMWQRSYFLPFPGLEEEFLNFYSGEYKDTEATRKDTADSQHKESSLQRVLNTLYCIQQIGVLKKRLSDGLRSKPITKPIIGGVMPAEFYLLFKLFRFLYEGELRHYNAKYDKNKKFKPATTLAESHARAVRTGNQGMTRAKLNIGNVVISSHTSKTDYFFERVKNPNSLHYHWNVALMKRFWHALDPTRWPIQRLAKIEVEESAFLDKDDDAAPSATQRDASLVKYHTLRALYAAMCVREYGQSSGMHSLRFTGRVLGHKVEDIGAATNYAYIALEESQSLGSLRATVDKGTIVRLDHRLRQLELMVLNQQRQYEEFTLSSSNRLSDVEKRAPVEQSAAKHRKPKLYSVVLTDPSTSMSLTYQQLLTMAVAQNFYAARESKQFATPFQILPTAPSSQRQGTASYFRSAFRVGKERASELEKMYRRIERCGQDAVGLQTLKDVHDMVVKVVLQKVVTPAVIETAEALVTQFWV